jgi:hypothetical protein
VTSEEILAQVQERISRDKDQALFGADEIRLWPDGAHAALVAAGVLGRAEPAQVISCDGCERNCFKPVHVRPRPDGRGTAAFISCDEPEDFGRIRVELRRLEQWQAVSDTSASELAQALRCHIPPELAVRAPRHASRDTAIKAKYAELARLGRRNFVKEIRRTVSGADSLSERRIRDIAKGR